MTPIIFQVVGYQNSGKTTFIEKLIQYLTEQGVKTAVIKHHGHGGKPDISGEKDSTKYLKAGAIVSSVEGGGRLILQADYSGYSLKEQIDLISMFHPGVVLIEGYKEKEYPKLLFLRNTDDLLLLDSVPNVVVIGYWQQQLEPFIQHLTIPHFFIHDELAVCRVAQLLKNIDKENSPIG